MSIGSAAPPSHVDGGAEKRGRCVQSTYCGPPDSQTHVYEHIGCLWFWELYESGVNTEKKKKRLESVDRQLQLATPCHTPLRGLLMGASGI